MGDKFETKSEVEVQMSKIYWKKQADNFYEPNF